MGAAITNLNRIVTACLAVVTFSLPLRAEETRLDALLSDLSQAEPAEARKIAAEIELEWSKSGSPAMDLLLRRGEDAIEAGDLEAAVEHLSALIDHAPQFAQGWHLRSVAFFKQERYGLGVLLDETGHPDLAHDAFSRALAIHPHHKDVSEAQERVARKLGGAEL
jgi:tetratricopeptide (TPR) repeat protein